MPSLHEQLLNGGGAGLLMDSHGERTQSGAEAKATLTLPSKAVRKVTYIVTESPNVASEYDISENLIEVQRMAILVARDQFETDDLPLGESTTVEIGGDKYAVDGRPTVYGETLCTIYLSRQPLVAHGKFRRGS